MESPRSVVIPLGVPDDARGLGLGLAALVHAFVHLDGQAVAIAQLHSRPPADAPPGPTPPVEAFVPPAAWRDMAARGDGPSGVGIVVTGSFDPPSQGSGGTGAIRLLAFDPADGRTRASVDVAVDGERAGAALVGAIEDFGGRLGGQVGAVRDLRELDWEPLESVLLAERCAMHDPARGGPHDQLAAMLHLGRAIGDAPGARYPAERLAAIALAAAGSSPNDPKLGAAALRALERAASDAGASVDLVEAHGVLLLRLGEAYGAERRFEEAVALAPTRARLYALLAQALRAEGRLDAALTVLDEGERRAGADAMVLVEKGAVLAARGDVDGAAAAWRQVLSRDPVHPGAFGCAAGLAMRARDAAGAQALVDAVLAAPHASVDVLRSAVQLALASETEGIARASRVRWLAERWIERTPSDPTALLVLARSLIALGEPAAARVRLEATLRIAPRSLAAAEAHALRLAVDSPDAEAEVQSVMRAASTAAPSSLAEVAVRARRLAVAHGSWRAWLAAATAERRLGRWDATCRALQAALEIAPGAARIHYELADALLRTDDPSRATAHARDALRLEGPSAPGLRLLARALADAGHADEAIDVARQCIGLDRDDRESLSLLHDLEARSGKGAFRNSLERRFRRWRSR